MVSIVLEAVVSSGIVIDIARIDHAVKENRVLADNHVLAIVVGQMKSREQEATHRCRKLEESQDRLYLDYDRLLSDYWSKCNEIDNLEARLANNKADLISELQENITSLEEACAACTLLLTPPIFFNFQVNVNGAYHEDQKVVDRANRRLSKLLPGSPKDLRHCVNFGVLTEVAVETWEMMNEHNCLPPDPKFVHFLRALAFMQTYPTNDKALLIALGSSDPKTICKYIWPFIDLIFELDGIVVS